MKILLIMTTGMSLKKWDKMGQLSRELRIYDYLSKKIGEVLFYSYGYREYKYIQNSTSLGVISKKSRFWDSIILPRFFLRCLNYLWNFFNLLRYRKVFKSIDIIKTNQFRGAIWGVILKRVFNKKLIIRMGYYHSHIKKISWKRLLIEKMCFSYADKLFVTSMEAQKFICLRYKISPNKVILFPNSIDSKLFCPMDKIKKYDLIYVGRISWGKNLKELLEGILKSKGQSFRSIFIGSGQDKKLLISFIKKYQLDITIIDRVDNSKLPYFYNISEIFILPSIYEVNPKTLLEAMSCGLPVIASNVPGNKEIISHGVNGYLCKPYSDSISEALSSLSCNEKLKKRLGSNARKYILDKNSLESMIVREVNIYESLVNL